MFTRRSVEKASFPIVFVVAVVIVAVQVIVAIGILAIAIGITAVAVALVAIPIGIAVMAIRIVAINVALIVIFVIPIFAEMSIATIGYLPPAISGLPCQPFLNSIWFESFFDEDVPCLLFGAAA